MSSRSMLTENWSVYMSLTLSRDVELVSARLAAVVDSRDRGHGP